MKFIMYLLNLIYPEFKESYYNVKRVSGCKKDHCYYLIEKGCDLFTKMDMEINNGIEFIESIRNMFLYRREFGGAAIDLETRKLFGLYYHGEAKKRWLKYSGKNNLYKICRNELVKMNWGPMIEIMRKPFPGVYSFNEILFKEHAPNETICELIYNDNNSIIIKIETDLSLDNGCILSKPIVGISVVREADAYKLKQECEDRENES